MGLNTDTFKIYFWNKLKNISSSVARLIYELPENYEEECEKQGAVERWRGVKNAADLMMLLLIHLMNGTSLIEISVIAKLLEIGEMSDVAIMKRLAKCKDWFDSISKQLLNKVVVGYKKPKWLEKYTVTAVDASDVVEKWRTKRTFRLHYMLDIFNMTCAGFKITKQKVGETLCNYGIKKDMLIIGDRAYSTVEKAWDKMDQKAKSRNYTPTDEAKAFNEFFIVVTSLPKKITAKQVLETYRLRWQVEICFKRFKSILDFGDMPAQWLG